MGIVDEPLGERAEPFFEIRVLAKPDRFGKHDGVEALATRRARARPAAAEIPHAEKRGGITAGLERFRKRDDLGRQF